MSVSKTEQERRLERLQAAFKKYDFVFEEEGRDIPPTMSDLRRKMPFERVQKSVRMRVKYTCHNCSTIYGHDRICLSCQHRRCPQCIRYPPRKEHKSKKEPEVIIVDSTQQVEIVEQECACHECQTGFQPGTQECPNCHHQICPICLKEALVTIASEASPLPTTTDSKPELLQEGKPPEPTTSTKTTTTTPATGS